MVRIATILILFCVFACEAQQHRFKRFPYRYAAAGGGPTTAPTYVSSASGTAASATTCTANTTVSAGSSLIMLVAVMQGNSAGAFKVINSVVWSGNGTPQNLTAISGFVADDANFCHVDGFYLVNPTPQTGGTVVATFASSSSISGVLVTIYSGANQTPVFSSFTKHEQTSSASLSVSMTPGTGRMAWAATCNDANGAITIGGTSTETSRIEVEGVSSDLGFAIGDAADTGTITWTWSPPDNGGVLGAILVDGL